MKPSLTRVAVVAVVKVPASGRAVVISSARDASDFSDARHP
ncbi:hypothetical protein [Exilibacterium tricleocarpae]|nr:hypothetical protein [Exilibacterium tricleocarpae]